MASLSVSPSSAVKGPSNSYAGGVGGKLRDRRASVQRKKTPYDRPSSGRHAAPGGASLLRLSSGSDSSRSSIASRLVGSASRLLSSSALLLYSSIFNRRTRVNSDSGEGGHPDELEAGSPLAQVEAVHSHNDVSSGGDITEKKEDKAELLEVEEILKNKMISREQFNRLTEILRSRIAENNADGQLHLRDNEDREERDLHKNDQQLTSPQSEAQRWREDCKTAQKEKGKPLWAVGVSTPMAHSKISGVESSTPVEMARAFMGERTARASGSFLSIRGHAHLEQLPVQTSELWRHGNWVPEERFWTPAVHISGRSSGAFLRTPYSRSHISPSIEVQTADTLPSRWTPIPLPVTRGREGLKRRSSVLDADWSIGGSIRRTRPKTLAFTASNNPPNVRAGSAGKGMPHLPVASVGLKLQTAANPVVEGNNGALSSQLNDDKKGMARNLVSVPVQANEMARKILETLDKMTPSPKGKSLEEELILVRERPPTELTANMLNEHARKTMQVVDYPPMQESHEAGPSSSFENKSPDTEFATSGTQTNVQTRSRDKETLGTVLGPPELYDKVSSIDSVSFPVHAFKSEKWISDERSASKPLLSNISASEAVKREGFRMNAVFEESNSDDEVWLNIKGAISSESESLKLCTPVSTDSLIKVSTAPDPSSGGKEPGFLTVPTDSLGTSSVEPAMTNVFTFPFASSGVTSELPSPKPLPFPSSFGGTISSSLPVTRFGMPSLGSKGPIFSFSASTSSEQATMKLDAGESKTELLALSGASATASFSSLPSSTSGQVFPDSKTSIYASNAVPVQLPSSVSKIPTLSSGLSTGDVSQVSQALLFGLSSNPATSAMPSSPLNFSSPALFSQMMPYSSLASSPFVGSSITTDSDSFNAVSSSSLFGATHTATALSSSSSCFGQQKIPSQLGFMGSTGQEFLFSSGSVGEVQRPQKGSISVVEQDTSQFAAIANGSSNAPSCSGGAVSTTAVSMSAGVAPIPFSFSNQLCSGSLQSSVPLFNQSSQALTSSASVMPSPVFVTTASSASSLLVSSSFPSSPMSFGRTSSSSSGSLVSSTLGQSHSSDTFGDARLVAFGVERSSFQAASSSPFGATNPAFETSSPALGTASSFAFGSSTVSAFGLSNSLFGSPTAKPFGIFAGDSTVQATSTSTPVFCSSFGMGSIGFGSSFSSSSSIVFGAGLASSPAENNVSFGSSSNSMSSSPFSFGTKGSSALPQIPLFGSSPFGSSASVVASGDTSTNDQMEDSMAEEPPQVIGNVTPQIPIFGATSPGPSPVPALATPNFVFGAQPNTSMTGQSVFTFGAQSMPNSFISQGAPIQNPFVQPANLDYGGGGFSLGASGGDKSGRKFIKAKRTGGAKRGR